MKRITPPVRMGIIGYGGMARYHADRWQKTGLLKTVGVYDTDPAQQKTAQKNGYIAYDSADELLADKTIEGVLIATPNDFHRPYAVAAANAGKHILCEKPVALSCDELD
ncbi:MAG: Gfo/Idh/MocA family oxidoreductase, partial [Clostridiales bacterium]|nr:Gfo/Idh/MocA family oxidoreductase [Clostridiales bacterium]